MRLIGECIAHGGLRLEGPCVLERLHEPPFRPGGCSGHGPRRRVKASFHGLFVAASFRHIEPSHIGQGQFRRLPVRRGRRHHPEVPFRSHQPRRQPGPQGRSAPRRVDDGRRYGQFCGEFGFRLRHDTSQHARSAFGRWQAHPRAHHEACCLEQRCRPALCAAYLRGVRHRHNAEVEHRPSAGPGHRTPGRLHTTRRRMRVGSCQREPCGADNRENAFGIRGERRRCVRHLLHCRGTSAGQLGLRASSADDLHADGAPANAHKLELPDGGAADTDGANDAVIRGGQGHIADGSTLAAVVRQPDFAIP
mmetsp:Transcript_29819/g.86536  ORF Transcript_29819/g.86536 Transcript_29819/m.86536 type:complete len:307 (-) Transcript_29819:1316-2236(-)